MTFINELTDLFQVLFWSSIISLDLLQGTYFFENLDKEILMDGCSSLELKFIIDWEAKVLDRELNM